MGRRRRNHTRTYARGAQQQVEHGQPVVLSPGGRERRETGQHGQGDHRRRSPDVAPHGQRRLVDVGRHALHAPDRRSRGRGRQQPPGDAGPYFGRPTRARRCMCRRGRDGRVSPMIKVEGLTRAYGSFIAVNDISFECQPGTVTGFLGPNGAGKTTTMRVMVGLTPATHGEVTIGGMHYKDIPNPGRHVGVLLDASAQHAGPHRPRGARARRPHHGSAQHPRRRDARPGLARRQGGQASRPQLLARHAAAARHRPRAAR